MLEPLLDAETLKTIANSCNDDIELITELLRSFIADCEEIMHKLNLSADNNQVEEVRTQLHTLKGLAGTIGALRLRYISQKIETLIDEDKWQEALLDIQNLEVVLLNTCNGINNYIYELKAQL